MRPFVVSCALMGLAACSGGADDAESSVAQAEQSEAASTPVAGDEPASTTPAPNAEVSLPLDLALAAESWLPDGVRDATFNDIPMDQFVIHSKQSSADILTFYKAALEDLGFDTKINSQDEYGGSLRANRADGTEVSIYSAMGGSYIEDDESASTFTVTYPKE